MLDKWHKKVPAHLDMHTGGMFWYRYVGRNRRTEREFWPMAGVPVFPSQMWVACLALPRAVKTGLLHWHNAVFALMGKPFTWPALSHKPFSVSNLKREQKKTPPYCSDPGIGFILRSTFHISKLAVLVMVAKNVCESSEWSPLSYLSPSALMTFKRHAWLL